jgi:hypothetical protein
MKLAAVPFLALGLLVAPLRAASLSGSFEGDATLTPTGTPGVYTQSFTGDGADDTYGAFTPSSTSTTDFSHPPSIVISNGMLTEAFEEGSLLGTSSGDGTANGNGMATFSIDYVITGGTGLFAGANGEATLMGTITTTSPTTESITGTYVGSFTVPEPTAFALGAVGLVGCGLRRRRRI